MYATLVGETNPGEMYIISAHMDGRGGGEAANDDGSGTALVMEIARVLAMEDIESDAPLNNGLSREPQGEGAVKLVALVNGPVPGHG